MAPSPFLMIVIGALLLMAGFAYAWRLRRRGGVPVWSRSFVIVCLMVGGGAGIVAAGVIALADR